jgi:tetratricopeptide (TPR) repeat protein
LGSPNPAGAGWLPPLSSNPPRLRDQSKNPIPIIVILIVGALAFIYMQSRSTGRKAIEIKDSAAMDAEIENTNDTNEKRQLEIMTKGKDTQQYAEAQSFYLRGFREYREGNFSRAIQNFEAALALYPDHPLAKRYLSKSRLKLNETITAALERGERDFQLQKYLNAFNEYRTVLLLTNDPRNKNAQLAQKRIEAIQLILTNSK